MFSKKEFLGVQDKLYDAFENILKKDMIANLDFQLIEQDLFYRPDKDTVINKKYTPNINRWLQEISWIKGNIIEELLLCLAYDDIYEKFDTPLKGRLQFINRERYFKLAIYDLFTFREKIAFLIYEVFNREIKICIKGNLKQLKKEKVSFYNIKNGIEILGDCPPENVTWINNKEFKLIKDIMIKLNADEPMKIFKQIRHPFTHRSNPGIDCLPLYSFEYKKIETKDCGKSSYISKWPSPLEEHFNFKEVICDVLKTWKLFISSLEKLIKNVSILNKQVRKIYDN